MHVEWIEFTTQFPFYIPTQRTPMPVKWTQPQSLSHLSIYLSLPGSQIAFNSSQINFSLAGVGAFGRPENRGQTHTSAQTKLGGRQKQCVDLSNRPQGHKFVLHSHSDTLLTRRIGSRRSTDQRRARAHPSMDASRRSGDAPAAFHLVHVTTEIMQFSSEWVNAGAAVAGWMWKKIGAHRRTQILSQAQLLLGCNHCAFGPNCAPHLNSNAIFLPLFFHCVMPSLLFAFPSAPARVHILAATGARKSQPGPVLHKTKSNQRRLVGFCARERSHWSAQNAAFIYANNCSIDTV